jgi:hypothetical protein
VELYLNGSVYGAILHQRKTLPLHASCFQYQALGIMICGESGVGKSSLTTSFCLNGATFLTDDVTPILFCEGQPRIWNVSDRIKLWSDSLQQLNQPLEGLERIMPQYEKFYLPIASEREVYSQLQHIFILYVHDEPKLSIQPLTGVDRFAALRNQLYRPEYLCGMPESEATYIKQLVILSQVLTVTNIFRPDSISIEQLRLELGNLLTKPTAEAFTFAY